MTRYRCVTARKAEGFNIADACDVARPGIFAWVHRTTANIVLRGSAG